jgi:hypothetical protein
LAVAVRVAPGSLARPSRRKGGHEDPALHLDPVESFDLADVLARVIMVKM